MSAHQTASSQGKGGRSRQPCSLPTETSTASFWHSEPSPLLLGHRSTRELPQTADVVVIGSGMTGASVAHYLLTAQDEHATGSGNSNGKFSRNVVMLEAREACWGATGRNGGHCAPKPGNPLDPSIGRFELGNYHALQTLISDKEIECEFVPQAGVHGMYDNAHVIDAELLIHSLQDSAPDLAANLRVVTDREELKELRIPTATGAVVSRVAARMWPYKFVARILEDLLTSTELRGTFNLQTLTPVESIASQGGDRWTVKTARGCIVASQVVLATNGYTSHLLPEFADLIVPCRGQMSALVPLPSVSGENRLKSSYGFVAKGMDDYLVQRPNEIGGQLMLGGGRQNGRSLGVTDDSVINPPTAKYLRSWLLKAFDLPEGTGKTPVVEPTVVCVRCRTKRIKCTRTSTPESCSNCTRSGQPCLNAPPLPHRFQHGPATTELTATHEWTGIMGYSRDSLPWVGQIPGKPNLFIAAGYTGHGMPNTWLCGKAVADMMSRKERPLQEPLWTALHSAPPSAAQVVDAKLRFWGQALVNDVGLPAAYLVTEERLKRARELEDLGTTDWAETERLRLLKVHDRPLSGYA